MVVVGETICPSCEGMLKYYDKVHRILRTKAGSSTWITIRRLKCIECGMVHRELPKYVVPHAHYEIEVILGVLEGLITSDTLGYEDYPCEATMERWMSKTNDFVLTNDHF